LLVANASAFREAVRLAKRGQTAKATGPEERYFLGNLTTSHGNIEAKTLPESVDKWIELLPELPRRRKGSSQPHLLTYLRDEEFSDESRLSKTLGPYLPALLQLAIRGHWIQSGRANRVLERSTCLATHVKPGQAGTDSLSATVRENDVMLAMESSATTR